MEIIANTCIKHKLWRFYAQKKERNLEKKEMGFVIAVHRDRFEVEVLGKILYAKLKTGVYYNMKQEIKFPTVGDEVDIIINPLGDSLIVGTKERKTRFLRDNPTPGMGEQTIAANFDYVFIMMSLNHNFNLNRMERYLTLSWQSGAIPVVILTKVDLSEDADEKIQLTKSSAVGVDVHAISSFTGYGMDKLNRYFEAGKIIVFLGSSGVGKSTFANTLLGKNVMDTNEIRADDSEGHHTTTHRQVIKLPSGAMIIDTPGMRELGMWEADDGVSHAFEDIEDIILKCKFKNCSHKTELSCAVKIALQNGTLNEKRWTNYNMLKKESERAKQKETFFVKQKRKNIVYKKEPRRDNEIDY